MDSDDERTIKRPRTSLTQLMAPSPPRDEVVPNSCSEDESDDDVPLIPLPIRKPPGEKKMPGWMTDNSSGRPPPAASTPVPRPRPLVGKSMSNNNVQVTQGYGGRAVYSIATSKDDSKFYCVQWRKPQQKKHKTWDGDAWFRLDNQKITMIGEDGKVMGVGSLAGGGEPQEGQTFRIGSYDTEVDRKVGYDEFRNATSVLNRQGIASVPAFMSPNVSRAGPRGVVKNFKSPSVVSKPHQTSGFTSHKEEDDVDIPASVTPLPVPTTDVSKPSDLSRFAFKKVTMTPNASGAKIIIGEHANKDRANWGGAVHDPNAEGAVVMPRPPELWAKKMDTSIVDVVIDPDLAGLMRDHQKEGVKFMYSCVMGLTEAEGEGCILADEMGLGKTLSAIALVYTMLKQSPFKKDTQCVNKVLIVCPVTLVSNWKKEFKKWVGSNRVNVVSADGKDHEIGTFVTNKHQHVMIIGYERLRKVAKQLAACVPSIDLIICDEGQRLKSKDNKTTKMFDELRTVRRILLSGTPVQNDLSEYWAMANFVNPGIFGRYSQFNRQFEKPILKGRAPGASKKDVEEGRERSQELAKVAEAFVIRRTAEVLDNYLPPKHEYVVFVAPSKLQLKIFETLLSPRMIDAFLNHRTQPLGFIDTLRKICNSPLLLKKKAAKEDIQYDEKEVKSVLEQALAVMPRDIRDYDVSTSGKMQLLSRMLKETHDQTGEKVVVVSNWTSTLDIIQEMLVRMKYPYLRLDGSTAQKTRQGLVDQFNRGRREDSFVFLLSAKAGGTGLNLIGASRLILFDSDWNPSSDLQAMARIHRDGQKRPVFIYRFLTACTIDEKIYQRQVTKTGLSDQMLDKSAGEKSSNSFSDAELRDLFTVSTKTDGCQTHDLLGCDCSGMDDGVLKEKDLNVDSGEESDEDKKGFVVASQYDPAPTAKMVKKTEQAKRDKLSALKKWKHLDPFERPSFDVMADTLLHGLIYAEWESLKFAKAPNPVIEEDDDDDDEMNGIESDDDQVEIDVRNHSAPSSGSGSSVEKAKKEVVEKKVRSRKMVNLHGHGGIEVARRHDLDEIARGGGGGKVMYMFEKVSKSKM